LSLWYIVSVGGESLYFEYEKNETDYLKSRDKLLGEAIDKIGHINRRVNKDIFSSVIYHIIGQQISTSAQATVWNRLHEKTGAVNAESILALSKEELQSIGITFKKVDYIHNFAVKVKSKELDLDSLHLLSDENVIKTLSSLKGIGVWTAEMIMLFCMQRRDIVSYGDLAILRGMRMLYHHRKIDKKMFMKYTRRYKPYGSVASLYLWAIAGGAIPEMRDYAPKRKG